MTKNSLFKDKKGKTVSWQRPNLPIAIWAAASLATKVTENGLQDLLDLIAFGAIFTWAYLEISDGANNFRRVLGAVVLVVTLYGRVAT